jgi:glycine oxidase ThiO
MVADVTVVGTGIIGLTSAIELADRGLSVRLVGTMHSGNASSAAGGMLAPSVHRDLQADATFEMESRDRYPGFLAALSERSGRHVPHTVGILEAAFNATDVAALERSFESPSRWLEADEVARAETCLAPTCGAVFHPLDGSVEPLPLLDALRIIVARHVSISTVREDCRELHASEAGCNILTDMEGRHASGHVVLAAGAWTPLIAGSGAAVESVKPVRGQMLAFESRLLRQVIVGAGGYLIPRSDGVIVAGGTMENAGFEAETTAPELAAIRARAIALCPGLRDAPIHSSWAGLRPMTPDMLPIIGTDPRCSRVIHACGHSRNGILLAPLTAEAVADIVCGTPQRHDIHRFRPGRD